MIIMTDDWWLMMTVDCWLMTAVWWMMVDDWWLIFNDDKGHDMQILGTNRTKSDWLIDWFSYQVRSVSDWVRACVRKLDLNVEIENERELM